jgi:hypothetical protein
MDGHWAPILTARIAVDRKALLGTKLKAARTGTILEKQESACEADSKLKTTILRIEQNALKGIRMDAMSPPLRG